MFTMTEILPDCPPEISHDAPGERVYRFPDRASLDVGTLAHLHDILDRKLVTALFQPIVNLGNGEIAGYEGLIRGPSNSPLHSPLTLFRCASQHRLTARLEYLCRRVVLESFAALGLDGRLFLNVSPECLVQHNARHGETLQYLDEIGLSPGRVIIELTESQPTFDYDVLRNATRHYRNMGFQIAMDDLGEGFSGLRLWSELRPDFVKIDMHFIQGINHDPVKLQFVRSIQEIAEKSGCRVIAEGIETQAELVKIRDLDIAYGQGYHLARPLAQPAQVLPAEVIMTLRPAYEARLDHRSGGVGTTAYSLLRHTPTVSPETLNDVIYETFSANPDLQSIAVVADARPVGLISRFMLIDRFARPFHRELYGKKPCTELMDSAPLVVDCQLGIHELSRLLIQSERHHLANGFIITENDRYLGIGTAQDLMRAMTDMQISAARHANPLTQLPGNVLIDDQIDQFLRNGDAFHVCYCDLNDFKPFNDVYGFRKGDELIRLTSDLLTRHCDPERDFVGHIGGDDFIVIFRSVDWQLRCEDILAQFSGRVASFFSQDDRERGGYFTEDRQGKRIFHPLTSLSLGVLPVHPNGFTSVHEVSAALTEAKKQAKKAPGNTLFIERRSQPGAR